MSFACEVEAAVVLSAEQLRAIMVAYQALGRAPEREQHGVVLIEKLDDYTVSFVRDMPISSEGGLFRGGGKTISFKISKKTYRIISTTSYLAR
jgi:hypothetical protein